MKYISIAILSFLLMACGGAKTIAQKNYIKAVNKEEISLEKEWISYSRGFCFGTCPVFEMTIYKDGSVLYRGKANVPQVGTYYGQLSKNQIEKLEEGLEKYNILTTPEDLLDKMIMDVPTINLRVVTKGNVHHIKHNAGGAENVKAYEKVVEAIINSVDLKIVEQ